MFPPPTLFLRPLFPDKEARFVVAAQSRSLILPQFISSALLSVALAEPFQPRALSLDISLKRWLHHLKKVLSPYTPRLIRLTLPISICRMELSA